MDKDIRRYYKQKQHGGRSTAARVFDGAALRLIFAAACYFWYQSNVKNQLVALALTAVTLGLILFALSLYRGLAFERFMKKERERLRMQVLREKLLLLPDAEFMRICARIAEDTPAAQDAKLAYNLSATPLNEDAVLALYRAARNEGAATLFIFTLSPLSVKARALLSRLPLTADCAPPERILEEAAAMEEYAVPDEAVHAYIRAEQQARMALKRRVQNEPFAAGNVKKYIIASVILMAASFVTGYALYYRLLAGLCASLAGTAFLLGRPRRDGQSASV